MQNYRIYTPVYSTTLDGIRGDELWYVLTAGMWNGMKLNRW